MLFFFWENINIMNILGNYNDLHFQILETKPKVLHDFVDHFNGLLVKDVTTWLV